MNKRLLTVAIASAMSAPMTAQAVKYKLSGQVNRAVVYMDDGVQSDVRHEDNISSGTRIRLRGSEDLGNGMKVGFYWEFQTSSNPSNGGGDRGNFPDANSDGNQNTSQIRHANVWFSGNWGRLQIGQGDGAGNGATQVTLDGTQVAGTYAGRQSLTAGIRWRTDGSGAGGADRLITLPDGSFLNAGASSAPDEADNGTYSQFDAFSRYDNVRYDTPALGPVTLSASIGNDAKWEVAAWYSQALFGGQLSGAVFYGEATGADNVEERVGGSVSYLFPTGTSITGHYAHNEIENPLAPEAESWRVAIGQKWGPHAVSISYGEATDVPGENLIGQGIGGSTASTEDTGFQIGYVHNLKRANTEIFVNYTHQELDHTFAGFGQVEDIDILGVGARVKFN